MKAIKYLVAAAMIAIAGPAAALGLGAIHAQSYLNQPFSASIPLILDSNSQLSEISVGLGTRSEFKDAGMPFDDVLANLHFKVVANNGVSPYIKITSRQIVRAPFLNFLVRVRWNGGTLLRQYTVLLDPESTPQPRTAPAPVVPAAQATPIATPAPPPTAVVSKPEPVAPRPEHHAQKAPEKHAWLDESAPSKAETKPSGGKSAIHSAKAIHPEKKAVAKKPAAHKEAKAVGAHTYGPVKPQETLWHVATQVRPNDKVTMSQVMLALYEANKVHFYDGQFDGLMKGSVLTVPSAAAMTSVSPEAALRRVQALKRRTAAPMAKASPKAKAVKPAKSAVAANASKIAPKSTPKSAPGATKETKPLPAPLPSARTAMKAPTGIQTTKGIKPQETAKAATESKPLALPTQSAPNTTAETKLPLAKSGAVAATSSAKAPASSSNAAMGGANEAAAGLANTSAMPAPVEPKTLPRKAAASSSLMDMSVVGFKLWQVAIVAILIALVLIWLVLRRKGDDGGATSVNRPDINPALLERTSPKLGDEAAATGAAAATGLAAAGAVEAEADADASGDDAPTSGSDSPSAVEDAIADADFHLAYGMHGEAIDLLNNALKVNPDSVELKHKLAESYFAAGKTEEFSKTVEELQGKVGDSEWQELMALQERIDADGSSTDDPKLSDNVLDDPSDDHGGKPTEPTRTPPSEDLNADTATLDDPFVLDEPKKEEWSAEADSEEPELTPESEENADDKSRQTPGDQIIDFDLGEDQIHAPEKSDHSDAAQPGHELDLSEFDLDPEPVSKTPEPQSEHRSSENTIDFSLDDFDAQAEPAADSDSETSAPAEENEHSTKLDLARVYADMGDNEAALGLLAEVRDHGSDAQRKEAESLIKRLQESS